MTTPPRMFAVLGALAAALLLPATVRADAIDGPPACPPGARGESAHAGVWCVPWTCTNDETCGPSAKCRPWRVCTRASDVTPGGLRAEPPAPERMQLVVGTCDPSLACRGDEEPPPALVGKLLPGPPQCRDDRHCVPSDLPALPPRTAGSTANPAPPAPASAPASAPAPAPAPNGPPPSPTPGCGCTSTDTTPTGGLTVLAAIFGLTLHRRRRP